MLSMDVILLGVKKDGYSNRETGEYIEGLSLQFAAPDERTTGFAVHSKLVPLGSALYSEVNAAALDNKQWPCKADLTFGMWNSLVGFSLK